MFPSDRVVFTVCPKAETSLIALERAGRDVEPAAAVVVVRARLRDRGEDAAARRAVLRHVAAGEDVDLLTNSIEPRAVDAEAGVVPGQTIDLIVVFRGRRTVDVVP